jgi:hypothetical protein
MFIQSKFKDYYDSAAHLGIDRTILFNRETNIKSSDITFFLDGLPAYFPDALGETYEYEYSDAEIAKHNKRQYTVFTIIGFCGKLYIGLFNTLKEGEQSHSMVYYGEDLLTLDWRKDKRQKYPSEMQIVKACLEKWHGKEENKLFKLFNSPIFKIEIRHSLSQYELKNKGLYLANYVINPNLNDLQFYKLFDVYSAFQTIQSYISGVLGSNENNITEVSNTDRIVKAGFDLKTSFRKDKKH